MKTETRTDDQSILYTIMQTPLGPLLAAGTEEALMFINFQSGTDPLVIRPGWKRSDKAFQRVKEQMEEYFAGERKVFDLALAPRGTLFQRSVWTRLRQIPYGSTTTYGELARRLGQPTASRAVGAANGSNPLPVVIPCHRVIGAGGKLTGYHGGLRIKRYLLALETSGTDALFAGVEGGAEETARA